MKTYSYMLREPRAGETAFRARHFDAAIGKIRAAEMLAVNPNLYMANYWLMPRLGSNSIRHLTAWCAKNYVMMEPLFLHKPDGSRMISTYDGYGSFPMNLGNNDLREWMVQAAKDVIAGTYWGAKAYPAPCQGIMVDCPVWWSAYNVDKIGTESVEYAGKGALYQEASIACVQVIQNRLPEIDVIPNMSAPVFCLDPAGAELIGLCHGFMVEVSVDFSLTQAAIDKAISDTKAVIDKYPTHKKFIGLKYGSDEVDVAAIAAWLDDGNTYFFHNKAADTRLVYEWGYNPILRGMSCLT